MERNVKANPAFVPIVKAIIGIVIAIIVIVAVGIPITSQVVESAGIPTTSTTYTIVSLIPLFLGLLALITVVSVF